jgi:AcrR family transcriptional regulator
VPAALPLNQGTGVIPTTAQAPIQLRRVWRRLVQRLYFRRPGSFTTAFDSTLRKPQTFLLGVADDFIALLAVLKQSIRNVSPSASLATFRPLDTSRDYRREAAMRKKIIASVSRRNLFEGEAAADRTPSDYTHSFLRPGVALEGRNEILLAAAEVFTEKGFAAASIDDIADRLKATKGRVYHYYRSKTDLFLDLQRWALEYGLTRVRAIAERTDLTPPHKLHAMAYEHTLMIASGYGYQSSLVGRAGALINVTKAKQRDVLRYVVALRDEYEGCFAAVIQHGVAVGVFVDLSPRLATKPLFGALNWLLVWYDADKAGGESLEAIADMQASFVVNAVSKRQP